MESQKLEAEQFGEAGFLQSQAEDAQAAIKHVLVRMKNEVARAAGATAKQGTEVIGEHPYVSIGAALAGGFLAGTVLTKSKKQKVLQELAQLEKAMALAAGEKVTFEGAGPKGGGLINRLMKIGMKQVTPAVVSALAGAVTAHETAETERVAGVGDVS